MLINNRFFSVFRTAARGLEAQRIALGTATENLANASTSRTGNGATYAIKRAVHEVPDDGYKRFNRLLNNRLTDLDQSDPRHFVEGSNRRALPYEEMGPETYVDEVVRERREFDPTHPHADADGYVTYPDVNIVDEMARMISANRIYEANISTVQAAKEMFKRTLDI